MGKKKTTEQFIEDARKVHGGKYDYSKVEYVNKRTKITIICPVHGEFEQTPDSHLQGNGCRKCKYEKQAERLSGKDTFVNRAKEIHGDKYNYDKVNYVNNHTKIIIGCPIHGDFEQTPSHHLNGHGCTKCRNLCTKNRLLYSQKDFVDKAIKVHGTYYDYSKVRYVNSTTKVEIICPIHGSFWQTPKKHFQGSGCNKCGYKRAGDKSRKTTVQFVNEARKMHGNRYDYSETDYVNTHSNVKIICPVHGVFYQNAYGHLNGYGCPKCILKEQNKIYEFLTNSFPDYTWEWEYNRKWLDKQRIDICCESAKLAVEYNGPQHYMPMVHYGGEKEFAKTIKRDNIKQSLCKQNGFCLYIIKYDNVDYDKIREDINNILNSNKNETC